MNDSPQRIEIELTAIAPENPLLVREQAVPEVEAAVTEAGRASLLEQRELQVDVEQGIPTDPVTIIVVTMLSQMAIATYKDVILPRLKARFGVKERPVQPAPPSPSSEAVDTDESRPS